MKLLDPRFRNVMVRLAGFWFALGGVGFGAWAIYFILHPDDPRRINTDGTDNLVVGVVVAVFTLLVGAAFLTVRTYRPDLGDSAWSFGGGTSRDAQKSRSWWTGEPRR